MSSERRGHWIVVIISCLTLKGMGRIQCGNIANCTCGSIHTVIENEDSAFFQLEGLTVRLMQNAPNESGPGMESSWSWKPWPSYPSGIQVPSEMTAQLSQWNGSLTINPMNESVDGAQFNYSLSRTSPSTLVYQSGWATGHLGKRTSIQPEVSQRFVSVTLYGSVDIKFNVSGVPDPVVELQKDGMAVSSDKYNNYELENGVLRLSHVNESDSGNYTIKASNCFNSASETLTLNVLINATVDSSGGAVNAKCGENVTLLCTVRANPQPDIRWYFTSLNSFQTVQGQRPTAVGENRYLSILHIVNVALTDQGTYRCVSDNGLGRIQTVDFNISVTCRPNPPDVHVSGKTNETVTLSISAPSYTGVRLIEHYSIVYGHTHLSVTASPDPTLVTVQGLSPNTIYMLSVTAHNGLNSSEATILSVQTEGVPGRLKVEWHSLFVESEIGCQTATIPFEFPDDRDSGIVGYTVKLASVDTEMELEVSPVNETEITLDGLSENTAHTLQIKARNKYGYGPGSKTYTFQTTECIVQVKSVGISVAAGVLAVMITFALLGAAYSRYRWRKLSIPIEPAMSAELSEQIELRGRIVSKTELDTTSVEMEEIQIELESGQNPAYASQSPFEARDTNQGEKS